MKADCRYSVRHPIVTEDLDQILSVPLPWEVFSGTSVLISGASGLLGSYCCEVLLRLNEINRLAAPVKVIAVSRNLQSSARRFSAYAGRPDLVLLQGDVCTGLPAWDEAADYVLHGASPASPTAMAADLLGTFEANVSGTRNMLKLAQAKQARKFLFLSSGAVYGNMPPEVHSIGENDFGALDPLTARAAYDEGKRAGETLCWLYADKFGLSASSARIAHTYGPGLKADDGRSFADFITAAAEGRPLVLNSDGSAIRYFCYLSDTTAGLFTILLLGESGQAYNLGSATECCSIRELAQLITDLFPERGLRITFPEQVPTTRQAGVTSRQIPIPFNTSKLKALGWMDRIKLAPGLRRTILSYEPRETE
ncbi:MAG: NAD-dependent epimerase/dehydratase family protein [Deltaproteobacteria bacterium]|jgi:dTDP-glucose 4,6-dehydratase|nr:NAD-dependent epimerase/dehydratase family protein [Deltaproteobacteria bacterium]